MLSEDGIREGASGLVSNCNPYKRCTRCILGNVKYVRVSQIFVKVYFKLMKAAHLRNNSVLNHLLM